MAAAVMDKDFKLVTPDGVVEATVGDDVTLPCHLSPETSAVAMEIRWFKGTDCIYLYKNGHVTEGRGYEGRVSVNTQELQRGDVSLRLRERREKDEGVYTCQVISGEHKEEGRVGLSEEFGWEDVSPGGWTVEVKMGREITAEERKRMEESVQSLVLRAWRKATDDELMKKINQLENKASEVENTKQQLEEKTKQQLEEKNKEMEKTKQQLEDKHREMQRTKQQLEEKNKEMEKTKQQLEDKNKEMEKTKQQLEEKNTLIQEREIDLENMTKQEKEREGLLENMTSEVETSKRQLESLENELQDRNSQLQDLRTKLQEQGRELEERHRQLEERDRQLEERDRQLEEKDRQLEERDRQLEERGREHLTGPDPPPVRRRRSNEEDYPNMGGESPGPAPPVSPAASELRLVLLGGSTAGKRAAGNTILGSEEFGRQASTHTLTHTSTETQHSESRQGEVAGRRVTVVETPDWLCSGLSEKDLRQDVGLCVRLSAPGPHAFLLVIPEEPSEGEEMRMLEKMEDMFGEGCWGHTLILFTHAEWLRERSVEELLQTGSQELQQLVEKCGNRCHLLNVKDRPEDTKITQLLEKIEEMVSGNRERFYSSENYLEAEKQLREIERRIQKEKWERMEREMMSKQDKEHENHSNKMKGEIVEKDLKILDLERKIAELEKELENEKNEEKKRELERQLTEEKEKRTKLEMEIERLSETSRKERSEMEERHRQEMKERRESYEKEARAEAEINLMKIILPELQRNITIIKERMEGEFNRQMEGKNREKEGELNRQMEGKNREIERMKLDVLQLQDRLRVERGRGGVRVQWVETRQNGLCIIL